MPGALEVRRTEGGVRAWAAESGEYVHALDGEYGGLWRSSARMPQQLVGVGFSSWGPFEGSHYRVLDAARYAARQRRTAPGHPQRDRCSATMACPAADAAGFELDSTEAADGSSPRPTSRDFLARSGEPQCSLWTGARCPAIAYGNAARKTPDTLIRSEIVYYETGYGGAVFSVGSITFCGALSHNDYQNDVSTLLRNVLVRFSHDRGANAIAAPAVAHTEVN